MTQPFRYKDFLVENFRSFKKFKIDDLSDINIIGGENGSGKSSLLEAAFHLADRGNPNTLFSDFGWRSTQILPQDFEQSFKLITHHGNINDAIFFNSKTSIGEYNIKYKFGPQSIIHSTTTNIVQPNVPRSSSADTAASSTSAAGYKITGLNGGMEDLNVLVQFNSQGMLIHVVNSRLTPFKQCMMVNSVTRRLAIDQATRFSEVVRAGKTDVLMEFIHLVHPKIDDLQLLTIGGNTIVHANIGQEFWVPINFLGEGAADLFTIALFMLGSENGIIFLDEFDSVVHHSLLDKLWMLIVKLSQAQNVQVFATTHSQESLESAVRTADAAGKLGELRYYRLRRDKQSQIKNVAYNGESLKNNIMESWEVR